jgi:hypothetical protein
MRRVQTGGADGARADRPQHRVAIVQQRVEAVFGPVARKFLAKHRLPIAPRRLRLDIFGVAGFHLARQQDRTRRLPLPANVSASPCMRIFPRPAAATFVWTTAVRQQVARASALLAHGAVQRPHAGDRSMVRPADHNRHRAFRQAHDQSVFDQVVPCAWTISAPTSSSAMRPFSAPDALTVRKPRSAARCRPSVPISTTRSIVVEL